MSSYPFEEALLWGRLADRRVTLAIAPSEGTILAALDRHFAPADLEEYADLRHWISVYTKSEA